jgi:hypothetical protein
MKCGVIVAVVLLSCFSVRGMGRWPDSHSGGKALITLRVVDETGEPVPSAMAHGYFWDPRAKDYAGSMFHASTDRQGLTTVKGRAFTFLEVAVRCERHYTTDFRVDYPGSPKGEFPQSWRDWVATNTVVLKRVRNPVPMYVRHIREIEPTDGECWGYDMLVGDWTSPLGEGETRDIEIRYDLEVLTTNRLGAAREFDATISFSFPGSGNGIQQVLQDTTSGSSYRMLYEAPLDGYVSQVAFRRTIQKGRLQTNANRDQCHYFRVRTKKDTDGNILHALYGKMPGDLTEAWLYYLNPDGTRNVEFDPDRNLFPPVRRYEGKFGP